MSNTMAGSTTGINRPDANINSFRKKILNWYDKHQRVMPWRAIKEQTPNPYHVWLSEIMLQQTTVATVGAYFTKFVAIWPTVEDLAAANRDDVMQEWAGLGYYARARNLHKCAQEVVEKYNGVFPQDELSLKSLAGIGDYTSASVRAIAFNKDSNVVDGNIERIMARLYAVEEPMPDSKKTLKAFAGLLTKDRHDRPGDYAQALMDIGATICTPKSPKCGVCPIKSYCLARKMNIQADLPAKNKKKPKPQRYGKVFWVKNGKNAVLFEKRGEKEMLGGMLGLPTTDWELKTFKKDQSIAVYHSFTHFDLKLEIEVVQHKKGFKMPEKEHYWLSSYDLEDVGVPTLFKKVIKLMREA